MRFLLGENVPKATLDQLGAAGHDGLGLNSEKFKGTPNCARWRLAQARDRLVVQTLMSVQPRQRIRQQLHEGIVWATENTTPSEWKNRTMVVRDQVFSFCDGVVERE